MNEFEPLSRRELWEIALRQPEYWHVLLHPIPVYGLGFALLAMVLALFLKNRRAEILSLVLVATSLLSVWPLMVAGQRAHDRILGLSDQEGRDWLTHHQRRAEAWIPAYSTLGGLVVLALLLPIKWERTRRPLYWATLLGGVTLLGAGAWISHAGGQIRHKEFRYAPVPELPLQRRAR